MTTSTDHDGEIGGTYDNLAIKDGMVTVNKLSPAVQASLAQTGVEPKNFTVVFPAVTAGTCPTGFNEVQVNQVAGSNGYSTSTCLQILITQHVGCSTEP